MITQPDNDTSRLDNRRFSVSEGDYAPVRYLVHARLLDFMREPEAVFWVCIFPVLMVLGLGVAFRNKPVESPNIDIVDSGEMSRQAMSQLSETGKFQLQMGKKEECFRRLRSAKTDLVTVILPNLKSSIQESASAKVEPQIEYHYDPSRPESVLARSRVDDALQRIAGRQDVGISRDVPFAEKGSRYIDFLVPGLMGMSLMGGGMWGVGFVTVDMRIRKLLKRFLATPLAKRQFLASILLARLVFLLPENLILLIVAWLVFGVSIQGNPLLLVLIVLLGAAAFAGIGLLVASRAKTVEAVSGLMNLVILPMWIFSGVFFSSERFPAAAQPIIQLLPLTALNHCLRGVMQDGKSAWEIFPQMLLLSVYAAASFFFAIRWFRWN